MYCIVLWACDHILDRSACDCTMSDIRHGKTLHNEASDIITSIVKSFDDECCQDGWQKSVIHHEILCMCSHLNSWQGSSLYLQRIHQDFLVQFALFLTNACPPLLLKWSGRVFSVLYQDSACLHTSTKNIYILHTPALMEYIGPEGSFVEVQQAACQGSSIQWECRPF